MRKSLVLLIVSIFSVQVFCQEFGTKDSEWVYNFSGNFLAGVVKISYEKDTLIGNRLCTKFMREYLNNLPTPLPPKPIYFYNNNGVVEFSFRGIDFDVLYDFNKRRGASWRVYRRSYINNVLFDSVHVQIDSTFKDRINGKDLAGQAVTYTGLTRNFTYKDIIYEQIGPKFDYIFPWDREERQRDGGEGGPVRCFHNDTLGLVELDTTRFINRYAYDCDQLVSINGNLTPSYKLDFYPNPVFEKLYIESRESSMLKIDLVDLLGRNLGQVDILPGENSLDLSKYSAGQYLLKIGGRVIHRILKE